MKIKKIDWHNLCKILPFSSISWLKNKLTDFIEVNINNLAAVPSIIFGLLGLAIFLNVMHLPRSAPVVGGMVLALMTLPTIIIATRASLKAVPPSIREAAIGLGATKFQTVNHHLLPLSLPGILTGTILGMSRALGESAPLLMIGMVAFIVDIPGSFTDSATVLPIQIYLWKYSCSWIFRIDCGWSNGTFNIPYPYEWISCVY